MWVVEPVGLRFDAIVLEFDIPEVGIVGTFIKIEVLGWLVCRLEPWEIGSLDCKICFIQRSLLRRERGGRRRVESIAKAHDVAFAFEAFLVRPARAEYWRRCAW